MRNIGRRARYWCACWRLDGKSHLFTHHCHPHYCHCHYHHCCHWPRSLGTRRSISSFCSSTFQCICIGINQSLALLWEYSFAFIALGIFTFVAGLASYVTKKPLTLYCFFNCWNSYRSGLVASTLRVETTTFDKHDFFVLPDSWCCECFWFW